MASFVLLARRAHVPAQNKIAKYKTLQNKENSKELGSGYNCNQQLFIKFLFIKGRWGGNVKTAEMRFQFPIIQLDE